MNILFLGIVVFLIILAVFDLVVGYRQECRNRTRRHGVGVSYSRRRADCHVHPSGVILLSPIFFYGTAWQCRFIVIAISWHCEVAIIMYYQCNTSVTSSLYFCSVNRGHDHIPRWHKSMDKEKAERIIKIVNWVRYIILAVFLTFVFVALSKAQTT